jgi:hypothetical protein
MACKTAGCVTGRKEWLPKTTKSEGVKASKREARGITDFASLGQPIEALGDSATEFGDGDMSKRAGRVSAHSLGRTSSALGPKRLKGR